MKKRGSALWRRLGEIRPSPPPRPVRYRRVYGSALIGVALLTALALLQGSQRLAVGSLVALVLGLLWVGWLAHRQVMSTLAAMVWWLLTAPAIGMLGSAATDPLLVYAFTAYATASVALLGVTVALAAVLTRARHVWQVLLVAWFVDVLAVLAATVVLPRYALPAGAVATIAVTLLRSGALAGLPRRRDAAALSDLAALAELPATFRFHRAGGRVVVAGRTGTFLVEAVDRAGPLRAQGRRLTVGGEALDAECHALAGAADRIGAAVRSPVRPVVVLTAAGFPDDNPGPFVVGAGRAGGTGVLVLPPDLLTARLRYGHTALTVGQVRRLARRLRRWTAADSPPDPDPAPAGSAAELAGAVS